MKKGFHINFYNWLKSTEMFARPSKQVPGIWQLTEYYTETHDELLNFSTQQVKEENRNWKIEFLDNKKYAHQCNLTLALLSKLQDGNWEISGNYITLKTGNTDASMIKFQFAVEKGQLRLLKKDGKGKIEFFGFFSRLK